MDKRQEKFAGMVAQALKKAESTDSPEEAEALITKAQEMMTKYAIDEAMIASAAGLSNKADDPIIKDEFVSIGIYRFPLHDLAYYVLINNDIQAVETAGGGSYGWRTIDGRLYKETKILVGVGFKSDLDRARVLVASLQLQAIRAENLWWKENQYAYPDAPRNGHYLRRQFLFSFAHGVLLKLQQGRQQGVVAAEEQHGATSVALVLRDRSSLVRSEFEKFFPHLREGKASNYKAGDWAAVAAGRAAGQRADVGQPGVGNSRRELKS